MISISAVLNAAGAAIAADSTIATWITTNVGATATLKVFVGEDAQNPPGQSDAPYVVLAPAVAPYDLGDGAPDRRPVIDVDWALVNADSTTSGTVTTLDGIADVDALGHLIIACLKTEFGMDKVDVAAYAITPVHPLYEAGATITFKFDAGMGEPALT